MEIKGKFDLDAPLFTQSELCEVAEISQPTAAKWLHRKILKPTRIGRGRLRGGHLYSAMAIYAARTIGILVGQLAVPPSEAAQAAELVARGQWRTQVIGEKPAPIRWLLLLNRTADCWEYVPAVAPLQTADFNKPVIAVLAAWRDLTWVHEQCWRIYSEVQRAPGLKMSQESRVRRRRDEH
jgi:hypothetical protein